VSTTTVTTTAALNTALKTAHAGDVIQLAAGTYSGVVIKNFNSAGAVTITSADPNHHAVLTDLSVTNANGLDFTNLDFSFASVTTDKATFAFGGSVSNSQNITFDHVSVHGTLDNDPTYDIKGLNFTSDTNLTITNSEFQQLRVGMLERLSTNVTITNNNFHDLRVDGIDNSGSSHVTISGNTFSNFHKIGVETSGGDHGDGIQFWTQDGQSVNTDINITNNVMVQGQGRSFQGIFIQDETTGGVLPFQNVTISGNLMVGGSYQDLNVKGATGLTIANNTLVAINGPLAETPRIQLQNVNGATLTNNTAPQFVLAKLNDTNVTNTGSTVSQTVTDGGVATLTSWLSQNSHPMGFGLNTPSLLASDGGLGAAGQPNSNIVVDTSADPNGPPVAPTDSATPPPDSTVAAPPAPTPTPTPTPTPSPTPSPSSNGDGISTQVVSVTTTSDAGSDGSGAPAPTPSPTPTPTPIGSPTPPSSQSAPPPSVYANPHQQDQAFLVLLGLHTHDHPIFNQF
jgi:hypothetical protein